MIKVFVSILTLYNSHTDMYSTSAVITESTYEQCMAKTRYAGQQIITTVAAGKYDKILAECIPIENL